MALIQNHISPPMEIQQSAVTIPKEIATLFGPGLTAMASTLKIAKGIAARSQSQASLLDVDLTCKRVINNVA